VFTCNDNKAQTEPGLGNNDEGFERTEAVMAEGLDNLADIYELSVDDGIKPLCSRVRKSGDTMQQPDWMVPDPSPNQYIVIQVPRTGKNTPAICEQRQT